MWSNGVYRIQIGRAAGRGSPRRTPPPRPHWGEILQIQDIKMSILLFRRVAIRGPSDGQTAARGQNQKLA